MHVDKYIETVSDDYTNYLIDDISVDPYRRGIVLTVDDFFQVFLSEGDLLDIFVFLLDRYIRLGGIGQDKQKGGKQ